MNALRPENSTGRTLRTETRVNVKVPAVQATCAFTKKAVRADKGRPLPVGHALVTNRKVVALPITRKDCDLVLPAREIACAFIDNPLDTTAPVAAGIGQRNPHAD